jgi:hypothetical protein
MVDLSAYSICGHFYLNSFQTIDSYGIAFAGDGAARGTFPVKWYGHFLKTAAPSAIESPPECVRLFAARPEFALLWHWVRDNDIRLHSWLAVSTRGDEFGALNLVAKACQ